jgi:8-hydroxy-5-deazaflavin:NADPH oxidoreductase
MKIGVIGAGRIGGTLGEIWSSKGHDVLYGVREGSAAPGRSASIEEAVAHAEVVVLAVPWSAVQDAVRACGSLSGKILVDCTNLGGDAAGSGAEKIAGWAPGGRVVKSFNQTGFEHLQNPIFEGRRALMLMAGDDAEAKAVVRGLGGDVGLEMEDAGGLSNARLLEALAELWIYLAFRGGLGRDFAFAVLRR